MSVDRSAAPPPPRGHTETGDDGDKIGPDVPREDVAAARTVTYASTMEVDLDDLALGSPAAPDSGPGTGAPVDAGRDRLRWVDSRDYEIQGEQGRGGIGVVYRARDVRLDRVVALKELQRPDRSAQARFESEMRITARLQHPGVVPVHEAGRWATGEPFYAMKFVEGRPLSEIIEERRTLAERLALLPNLVAVADTVAYAHGQGIIHRDLKPSNIILGAFGETVVVDWGLAKDVSEREPVPVDDGPFRTAASPSLTRTGVVIGTPAYMAPEQARGEDVDPRSDVYSMGALLYHVLAGSPPYTSHTAGDALMKILSGPPPPVEIVEPAVPSELATIVSKAMARAPAQRYGTAKELVEDLRRFHTGQLVSAHAYSRRDLFSRWLRKHRVVVSMALVALVAVGAIGVISVTRIVRERERAQREQSLAEAAQRSSEQRANALILLQARGQLDRDPAAAVAWLKQYPIAAADWAGARNLLLDARSRIVARHVLGPNEAVLHAAIFSPDGRLAATGGGDRHVKVWDVESGALLRQHATTGEIYVLAASAGGEYLAAAGARGVDVFDWGLRPVAQLLVPGASIFDLRFSPDSTMVAAAGGGSQAIHLIDLRSGRSRALRRASGSVGAVVFVDASALISGGTAGELRRWRLQDGSSEALVQGLGEIDEIQLSDDGRSVIAGDADGRVVVVDLQTRRVTRKHDHTGRVEKVAFAPGGRFFASTGQDGTVRLYGAGGEPLRTFRHDGDVYSLVFTHDGTRLISAGLDRTVRVWTVDGVTSWTLRGHASGVSVATPSGDDAWIISAGQDMTARIWRMPPRESRVANEHKDDIYQATFSRDGRFVATASRDRTVGIAEPATGRRWLLPGHKDLIFGVDFFPDSRRCASAAWDGTVRIWDVLARRQLRELAAGQVRIWSVRVSPNGDLVAAGDADGVVHVWDTVSWSHRTLRTAAGDIWELAFSPDSRRLAAGTNEGRIHVWSTIDWQERQLRGHTEMVSTLRFLDGDRLLSGSGDGTVRLWSVSRGSATVPIRQRASITEVAFARGGDLIASSSEDGSVALWRGGRTSLLLGHHGKVRGVAFSPDGSLLASAGQDGSVRMWRPSDGRLLDVLVEHASFVMDVEFSPDGRSLVSASVDRTLRVWPAAPADPVGTASADIRRAMAGLTSMDVSVLARTGSGP
jgi:eukaryotic-like serine/threonine-protein kinase